MRHVWTLLQSLSLVDLAIQVRVYLENAFQERSRVQSFDKSVM